MRTANIFHLGIKELHSLLRDPIMIVLVVFSFTISVYTGATATPETLHKAPIAIIDEDQSPLSTRIVDAFYPPHFMPPELIAQQPLADRVRSGPAGERPTVPGARSSTTSPISCLAVVPNTSLSG